MINHKVLSLIGLAMKAGKVVSGEFSTEKAVKTGTAFLVVVAESASGNTKRNSEIPALTTRFHCISWEKRKNWAGRLEKNSGLPWQ